ncbi:MAG: hypothetical protein AB7U73_18390 [Pirellulales bacterium]
MTQVPKYKTPDQKSAADVLGPWVESEIQSGLMERCRKYWTTPIAQLPNGMLATFLRQRIATTLVATEARKRIAVGTKDESELYEDELENALKDARLEHGAAD